MDNLVIFDMDGVLVDSEPAGIFASIKVIEDLGFKGIKPEEFKEFTGMGDDKFISGVLEAHGGVYTKDLKQKMYEIYVANAKEKVHVYPWSKPIITELHNIGFKVAVASASDLIKVKCNVNCIGVDAKILSAIVTGSDITRNKPAPDIFLKAAQRSSVDPARCVVTEDSLAGITAAKNAGMRAVGVTTSFSEQELYDAGADIVVDDLSLLPAIADGMFSGGFGI